MPETLQQRLNQLRRQIRLLIWIYGGCLLFSVLFGTTLLVGLLDWWLHFDDQSLRLVLGLGILGISGWIGWRWLISPLLVQLSDVELSLKIEQRYPGFRDSLASTVQFQESAQDPQFGAPELQQKVIEETLASASKIRVEELLETRRVWKVAGIAAAVALVTCCLVGLNQVEAGTAIQRLVFPFGEHPWPRRTVLMLTDADLKPFPVRVGKPERVARGETLELFVLDRMHSLPDDVHLEYRIADGKPVTEQLRKMSVAREDGTQQEVCVARLQVTEGPLFLRATGGDDHEMKWHPIDVVPPPAVEEFQLTLIPPAYTKQETKTLPPNIGHLRGMVGTKIKLTAKSNKKLKSAQLRLRTLSPQTLTLANDRQTFSAEFEIEDAGHQTYTWWLELEDTEGFTSQDPPRYDVQSQIDRVPDIYFEEPTHHLQVTPAAEVLLKLKTTDDLGLKTVNVIYRLNDSEDAPRFLIPQFPVENSDLSDNADERPQQLSPEYRWQLAELNLPVGTRVQFHAEATDDYDLGEPHVGRTQPLSLFVVSPEEKLTELLNRQATLLEELTRVRDLQQRARETVADLLIQLGKVGRYRDQDLDTLNSLNYEHRHQISGKLVRGETPAGQTVEEQLQSILDDLATNQLQVPEVRTRLERVQAELELLKQTHLPQVGRALNRALKLSASEPFAPDPNAQSLQAGQRGQTLVLESLDAMIGELSEWQYQQDVATDVQNLISGQEDLNAATGEMQQKTLGRPLAGLTPQEKAELAKLAARQRKQGEQIEAFQLKLEKIAGELSEEDTATAETIADTLAHLKQSDARQSAREVADQLEQNGIGQATTGQEQILGDLKELRDILNHRGVSDTETLVKRLKLAEDELQLIKQAQTELLRKKQEARTNPDPVQKELRLEQLRKEQEQLRTRAEALSRQLRRLHARRPGQSLNRATESMQRLEKQTPRETSPEDVQEAGQEILDDLEQAQRELAQEREQAEEQLARELLERIADELPGFVTRQQAIIEETLRLDQAVKERGNWSRTLSKTVKTLAETQQELRQDTETLMERLQNAEVVVLVLEGAAQQIDQAADRLTNRETDAVTVNHERAAIERFQALIDALKTDPQSTAEQQPPSGDPGEQNNAPPGEGIPPLAQLKLLRTLQLEINTRTAELHQQQQQGSLSEKQQQELNDLATMQGKIADLATRLVKQVQQAFEAPPPESDGEPEPVPEIETP